MCFLNADLSAVHTTLGWTYRTDDGAWSFVRDRPGLVSTFCLLFLSGMGVPGEAEHAKIEYVQHGRSANAADSWHLREMRFHLLILNTIVLGQDMFLVLIASGWRFGMMCIYTLHLLDCTWV